MEGAFSLPFDLAAKGGDTALNAERQLLSAVWIAAHQYVIAPSAEIRTWWRGRFTGLIDALCWLTDSEEPADMTL